MSKYKVGDKFEIEIAQVIESVEAGGNTLYRIKGFNALIFDDHGLNKISKVEPENPEVDWSKVEVDTPILVKDHRDADWIRRYFAKYEGGKIYAWKSGATSWSATSKNDVLEWEYAKLAEVEE